MKARASSCSSRATSRARRSYADRAGKYMGQKGDARL